MTPELEQLVERSKPVVVIDGVAWWHWLYEYDWDGAIYGFTICARSKEEADARLKRLPLARYVGQGDGDEIRANVITGIYMLALVWFRNLLRTLRKDENGGEK